MRRSQPSSTSDSGRGRGEHRRIDLDERARPLVDERAELRSRRGHVRAAHDEHAIAGVRRAGRAPGAVVPASTPANAGAQRTSASVPASTRPTVTLGDELEVALGRPRREQAPPDAPPPPAPRAPARRAAGPRARRSSSRSSRPSPARNSPPDRSSAHSSRRALDRRTPRRTRTRSRATASKRPSRSIRWTPADSHSSRRRQRGHEKERGHSVRA